jgi:hypothetical protein
VSTARERLVPGEPEAGGYRGLVPADGEQHVVRDELASGSLPAGALRAARPLLVIAHLSDTHLMDHQSPGRVELLDPADLVARFERAEGDALLALQDSPRLQVTPDPGRTPVHRADYVREHFRTAGTPAGHGFTRRNADLGTAYYVLDAGAVRCITLDTVNPHGGWQGSLDATQLAWRLAHRLAAAGPPDRGAGHRPRPGHRVHRHRQRGPGQP